MNPNSPFYCGINGGRRGECGTNFNNPASHQGSQGNTEQYFNHANYFNAVDNTQCQLYAPTANTNGQYMYQEPNVHNNSVNYSAFVLNN